MKRIIGLIIVSLASPLVADVVILNSGTRLEGDIKRTPDGYVVTDASGKTTAVAASDIRSIELKRKSASTNEPQVPARQTPAASQPAMTPQSEAAGNAAALQIMPLITAGKTSEASAMLDKAIAASPANASLLYLKGLILYHQNQLVPARKAFESSATALPSHAPTHNNLGVILYKTRAQMAALLEFDKAMTADPGNEQVLDNVLEALHALPRSYANNATAKKVAAHFTEQEATLEQKMAAQGLKRYGSQWISAAEFAKLESSQKAAQDKLDSVKSDAMTLQTQLMQLDNQIDQDTRTLRAMAQQQSVVDAYGRIVTQPLPPRYYELQREVEQLTAQRVIKQKQLEQLPKQAADAQKNAGTAQPFAGKQSIFDERYMPGAPPVPTTQPTTRPG